MLRKEYGEGELKQPCTAMGKVEAEPVGGPVGSTCLTGERLGKGGLGFER